MFFRWMFAPIVLHYLPVKCGTFAAATGSQEPMVVLALTLYLLFW